MCGITGIFSKNEVSKINLRIQKMNSSIFHRGPDAGDYFVNKNNSIALGHRRLSIIDTREISNQPMFSNSKDWVIVFNGEIYNFKEIKEKLSYTFKTESDTEVILASIEEKGVDWFLSQANGMFAIALLNLKSDALFLIRDRLGIKPFYFYFDDQNVIFSSEIKAILNSGLVEARFNHDAIDEYLGNRYVRAPYTFFKNIYQIEPASYISFNKDLSYNQVKYWSLPKKFNSLEDFDESEISEKFEKELTKAINRRLISDVPLGTYLSGGVDSSIITAITALIKNEKINTYTIGFKELNEFLYSQKIADKFKTQHHKIEITQKDYLDKWKELIYYKDSPLGVPNEIPLAKMSSILKEKITVVLSGEGADELMGGYGRIFRLPFDFENSINTTDFYSAFINKYEYVSREMRDAFINTPTNYREIFDKKILKSFKNNSNEESVFRFFHEYHVKGLLQRVDTTTMQASVEARVPFLDHELIEFVYKEVPYNLKLKWSSKQAQEKAKMLSAKEYSEVLDTPKYLLKKISYNYLPKEIIERKKVGFPVPLNNWFKDLNILALEVLKDASWLKPNIVSELINQSKNESRAGQILWMFINVELFRKQYFQKNWKWD